MYGQWPDLAAQKYFMWNSVGLDFGAFIVFAVYYDMPKSLKYVTPSMYANDTEIYASSKHGDELVANLNCDLENVRQWMLQNRLQMDLPTILKTKSQVTLF